MLRYSFLKNVGFMLALAVILWASSMAKAAPVTLRFEAVVASVPASGNAINLPFELSIGETLVGSITFEPGTNGPIYQQIGVFRVDIGGIRLSLPGFQILVGNDQQLYIDQPGRVADPGNTPDVDVNAIGENIIVSCSDGGSLYCGTVPGSVNVGYRPLLVLTDYSPLFLSSNELIADVNVWNAFDNQEMAILFKDIDTNATAYVGAYISQLQQVPEPSTAILITVLMVMACSNQHGLRLLLGCMPHSKFV